MAPYFRGIFFSGDYIRESEDLSLKPELGRGKESKGSSRPVKLLTRIKLLAKKHRACGRGRAAFSGRGRYARSGGRFQQRVVLKARVVRNHCRGAGLLGNHLHYLQREGVGIDGGTPDAFNAGQVLEESEIRAWAKICEKDRHHFRFILSPENGSELDLKLYARNFMRQMERDVETKLSWLAVTHHNTDNPHVHIIIRGKDDRGKDLVISREYISSGAREQARELATLELGYRTDLDVQLELQKSVTQARIVGLDHELIKQASWNPSGLVNMRDVPKPGYELQRRNRDLQLGRLGFLEGLGLACEVASGTWRLEDGFLEKLHSLGMRNDIIKTMHQRMRGINPEAHVSILVPDKLEGRPLSGKVLHIGLVNELYDTKYLLVEDSKRRVHYVSLEGAGIKCRRALEIGHEVCISVHSKRVIVQDRGLDRGLELAIERK